MLLALVWGYFTSGLRVGGAKASSVSESSCTVLLCRDLPGGDEPSKLQRASRGIVLDMWLKETLQTHMGILSSCGRLRGPSLASSVRERYHCRRRVKAVANMS